MKRYQVIPVVGLLSVILVLAALGIARAEKDSYLVGRLLGTVQPLPLFFRSNLGLMNEGKYPEFLGFRFINAQSGKKINMRPDSKGYFSKSLESGTWTLERLRKDRPGGEGPKVLQIMTFEIPDGSLANLGVVLIVVDGKPTERLKIRSGYEEGTYTYTYHYERSDVSDDNTWPLDNLKRKKSKILEKYKDNIIEVKDPVTSESDSSRVKLRGGKK